jgi:hypothetical protein
MLTRYQQARTRRMEDRHVGGRFRAGVLAPVMAHKFKGSEGGMMSQQLFFQLDPIPGRIMSQIYAEVVSVFVPVQALHALKNPEADYPGSEDVIRAALADGETLFDLEEETEISKRCGINPKSIGGVKKSCESARLAYIAAVNFLRRQLYVNATQQSKTETAILPAILSKTVLQRLNGVLDPEDRVNGAVSLNAHIPVRGIGLGTTSPNTVNAGMTHSDGTQETVDLARTTDNTFRMEVEQDAANKWYPKVEAVLGTQISVSDFYQAERMDQLVRTMRKFVDDNPEKGEEIVTRWAMGLSLDVGRDPVVLYRRRVSMNNAVERPMDGASIDDLRTYPTNGIRFTVPVPKTEFGGVVVTMASIKPDEVLSSQPHPMFTEPWAQDNFVADEMAAVAGDPVGVTLRELDSDIDQGNETDIGLYVGNHGLKRFYRQYGWNRHLDTNDVDAETSIWQLEVPMSVTPENVNYPEPLPQTPFADTTAEICTYGCRSSLTVETPLIFGPTPVEELAAIEDANIFEEENA